MLKTEELREAKPLLKQLGWVGVLKALFYKKLFTGLRDAPHPLLNWVGGWGY